MSNPREIITRFYAAFAARDHDTMARCYALRIAFRDVTAAGDAGAAHWEAWYTVSGTGRPVHNVIDATFTLRDGLIVRHVDRFDLYAWTRQALGARGALLGWAPPVQAAIRRTAAQALSKAMR